MGCVSTKFNQTSVMLEDHSEPLKLLRKISAIQPQSNEPPSKNTQILVSKSIINNQLFEIKIKNDNRINNRDGINNGVTGVYISSKVARLAGTFWDENIAQLTRYDQLEIGCAIYFRMITQSMEVRNKLKKEKMETTGLRFLEMITWLLRAVIRNDINLFLTLNKIGILHTKWNINRHDYELLIYCVHETMEEYFPKKYEIDIKYSMEQCLAVCMSIMIGDYKFLDSISKNNKGHSTTSSRVIFDSSSSKLQVIQAGGFLKSYDICVRSNIGREYLYRYLGQTWCSEIVLFLQLLHKYDKQDNDKGKFIVAKDIQKKCLTHGALFEINVSYDCFQEFQENMELLEQKFMDNNELFVMEQDIMANTRREIKKLIVMQKWRDFVETFKNFNIL